LLGMAKSYLAAGAKAKGIEYLQKAVKADPASDAGKEAKALLKDQQK
ncbi:hypothetical protein LCGC14_2202950, partial [marine sediment metagenome]